MLAGDMLAGDMLAGDMLVMIYVRTYVRTCTYAHTYALKLRGPSAVTKFRKGPARLFGVAGGASGAAYRPVESR